MFESDVIDDLKEQIRKLQAFKDFVHKKLDDFGVPSDPEPEGNKKHGCRIEGRLNWLYYVHNVSESG